MNEIVGACLSQFHDDENSFELLLAYSDGREVGFSVSRKVAQKMALELANGAGCDRSAVERKAEPVEHRSDCDFKHSPIQLCDCPSTPPAAPVRVTEAHVQMTGIDLLRREVEKLCTRDQGEDGALVSRASVLALIDLMPSGLHSDDLAVDRFAVAMKAKLAKKRADGRGGWENPDECSIAFLSELLREHVNKGDPVDVGNLSMMIHQRGGIIE